MALSKRCDRCGRYYQQKELSINGYPTNGIILIDRERDNRSYNTRTIVDFCPGCLKSFNDWLNSKIERDGTNESISE